MDFGQPIAGAQKWCASARCLHARTWLRCLRCDATHGK